MATIETAEGETLIVSTKKDRSSLYVKGRVSDGGIGKGFDMRLSKLYGKTALGWDDRPSSRGDLTAGVMETVANLLVGWAVNEGYADRRSEVVIEDLTVEERSEAKDVREVYVPDWRDDWPEDGSQSDKVRYLLDEMPTWPDAEVAAAVGCSRSLVSDVKAAREE